MPPIKLLIKLRGSKGHYEATALMDSRLSTTILDRSLADQVGVSFTGVKVNLTPFYGEVEAEQAVIEELTVSDTPLESELVAVASIPERAKELLRRLHVDPRLIVGLSTIERAGFVPDPSFGALRKADVVFSVWGP